MKNSKQNFLNKFQNWKENFVYTETNLGLTNTNYLLDKQFLLRQSSNKTVFFIQRKNEIAALKLLASTQINTPVIDYFFDKNGDFIYITKFLSGAKNFGQLSKTKNNLKKIASLIHQLHTIDYKKSSIKQLDMKENLINHINLSQYDYQNNFLNSLINKLTIFLNDFYWDKEVVLSHNDPLKENFLLDTDINQWYLIDYEYCSLNTPYYDIAVFLSASELVTLPNLLAYWFDLFQIKTKQQQKEVLFFALYRDVLGYFWARCMNINNPNPNYSQLMTKKLQQGTKTLKLLEQFTKEN